MGPPFPSDLGKSDLVEQLPRYTNSTLPLTEEVVLHHTQLVSEMNKLVSSKRLHRDIYNLLIRRNVLQCHSSSLNIITDEMVPDLNVLRPVMKHWILRELNATMIVAVDHRRPKLLIKQIYQKLAKPQ